MATGSGLGGLIPIVLTLAGFVTMARGWLRRRRGAPEPDPVADERLAATLESQRRMAAYLAQNRTSSYEATIDKADEENRT